MSANPERGEVEIVLSGTTYVLRPTWEALVAIEKAIAPKNLVDVVYSANKQSHVSLSAFEMAVIVAEGVRAYAKESTEERVKVLTAVTPQKMLLLIAEEGPVTCLEAVSEFVGNLAGGSKKK